MLIRSLFQDMRSRPHRVVHDAAAELPPVSSSASGLCRWSELPEELLREILIRVESADGGGWPSRRSVVACAGVCRGWRLLTKEIVATPEISSRLTFPISLKQPGPRDSLIQCFIKRNRTTQSYHLYLGLTSAALTDEGKFLLAACKVKRATSTDYIISMCPDDMSRRSNTYVGKLRSNFLGTKFTVLDGQTTPNATATKTRKTSRSSNPMKVLPKLPLGNHPIAQISFDLNVLGSRGPRRMRCVMDTIPASSVESPMELELPSHVCNTSSGNRPKEEALVLRNKTPRWHEQLRCWCLNFHGRVTLASVKNFQLVAADRETGQQPQRNERIILQFGKVAKDVFTMDFGYPISAFQAFAICLSSFETRIACE